MSNLDPDGEEDLYDFLEEWYGSNITLPSPPAYSSPPPADGPMVRVVIFLSWLSLTIPRPWIRNPPLLGQPQTPLHQG